jgi:signal peptidase I
MQVQCNGRRWISIGIAAVGCLLIARQHLSLSLVRGDSMEPTFGSGAVLLVHTRAYRGHPPERGDIVLAALRDCLVVKRVVGLPGEEIEVRSGRVYINDTALTEAYASVRGALSIESGRLGRETFALLGDNRDLTRMTPVHAIVRNDQVVGKVVAVFRGR